MWKMNYRPWIGCFRQRTRTSSTDWKSDDYEPAGPAVVPVESVEVVGDDVDADVVGMEVEREILERAPFPSLEGKNVAIQRRMSVAYSHLANAVQHEVVVQLGGDKVFVSRPSARDDVTNSPLDPSMTF